MHSYTLLTKDLNSWLVNNLQQVFIFIVDTFTFFFDKDYCLSLLFSLYIDKLESFKR